MRFYHSFLVAAAITIISSAAWADGIKMLPPSDFAGNVCAGAKTGVLQWDGTSPIQCIPGFMGDRNGNVGIGTTTPQAPLEVNGYIMIGSRGIVVEGDACSPNGLVGRDSAGALYDCQDGTWGRPKTFTAVPTTIAAVNAKCIIGDPTNPPIYNDLQYRLTCASRFCHRTLNYGFGMLTEGGPGYNFTQPYSSPGNTYVQISCSR